MYVASAARIWNRDSFCCSASSLSPGFFNLVENVVLQQRRIRILFTIALQCRRSQSSATKSEHFNVPRSQSCVQVFARYFWLHSPLGTAHAKFSFSPQYVSRWGDHAPFRHNHQHKHTKSESAKANQPQETPKGPLQIIISIADQRVLLYDNGSPCSCPSSYCSGFCCFPDLPADVPEDRGSGDRSGSYACRHR